MKKHVWRIIALSVTVLALGGALVALAGPPDQWLSSADPESAPPAAAARQPEIIGDDPDEDGYTGPLPEAGPILESSAEVEPSDPAALPNWEQFYDGPQPDEADGALDPNASIDGWSGFYYANIAGTTLRPRDSTVTWDNDGTGGCLHQTGGGTGEIFNIHLDLPVGSRIDYLRIYYYDTSANTSSGWVTSYDGEGGFDDLVSVTSSGNTGYGTQLSPLLSHVVNYASDAYVVNYRSNTIGNTMRLCGFRVAYRVPTP